MQCLGGVCDGNGQAGNACLNMKNSVHIYTRCFRFFSCFAPHCLFCPQRLNYAKHKLSTVCHILERGYFDITPYSHRGHFLGRGGDLFRSCELGAFHERNAWCVGWGGGCFCIPDTLRDVCFVHLSKGQCGQDAVFFESVFPDVFVDDSTLACRYTYILLLIITEGDVGCAVSRGALAKRATSQEPCSCTRVI